MELIFTPNAVADIKYWRQSGNKIAQDKISILLQSILNTPFNGIGKPEPLKNELSGKWSRRIDRKNRIIYSVSDNIYIHSIRGHYKK